MADKFKVGDRVHLLPRGERQAQRDLVDYLAVQQAFDRIQSAEVPPRRGQRIELERGESLRDDFLRRAGVIGGLLQLIAPAVGIDADLVPAAPAEQVVDGLAGGLADDVEDPRHLVFDAGGDATRGGTGADETEVDGTGDHGLPVGVQVLAPALGEVAMFRVAAALEAAPYRRAARAEHVLREVPVVVVVDGRLVEDVLDLVFDDGTGLVAVASALVREESKWCVIIFIYFRSFCNR